MIIGSFVDIRNLFYLWQIISITRRDILTKTKHLPSFVHILLQISPVPAFKQLWSGIQRNIHSHPEILDLNPDVHVNKVINEDYVFFCDKTYFEILAGKDCRFVIGEEEYPNMNYAIGLPNNSAYTRIFSTK